MILKFGEQKIRFTVKDSEITVSKHSGQDIETVTCVIRTQDQDSHEKLRDLIGEDKNAEIECVDELGNMIKKYVIVNSSFSYSGDLSEMTSVTHTIKLQEKEEFKVDKLIIDGEEFDTHQYSEKFDNEDLVITAVYGKMKV